MVCIVNLFWNRYLAHFFIHKSTFSSISSLSGSLLMSKMGILTPPLWGWYRIPWRDHRRWEQRPAHSRCSRNVINVDIYYYSSRRRETILAAVRLSSICPMNDEVIHTNINYAVQVESKLRWRWFQRLWFPSPTPSISIHQGVWTERWEPFLNLCFSENPKQQSLLDNLPSSLSR